MLRHYFSSIGKSLLSKIIFKIILKCKCLFLTRLISSRVISIFSSFLINFFKDRDLVVMIYSRSSIIICHFSLAIASNLLNFLSMLLTIKLIALSTSKHSNRRFPCWCIFLILFLIICLFLVCLCCGMPWSCFSLKTCSRFAEISWVLNCISNLFIFCLASFCLYIFISMMILS